MWWGSRSWRCGVGRMIWWRWRPLRSFAGSGWSSTSSCQRGFLRTTRWLACWACSIRMGCEQSVRHPPPGNLGPQTRHHIQDRCPKQTLPSRPRPPRHPRSPQQAHCLMRTALYPELGYTETIHRLAASRYQESDECWARCPIWLEDTERKAEVVPSSGLWPPALIISRGRITARVRLSLEGDSSSSPVDGGPHLFRTDNPNWVSSGSA